MDGNDSSDYYDDLTHYRESIHISATVFAVICACLTILNAGIFLTVFSKQCRAISATWYIYCLHVTVIFYGITLCIGLSSPAFYHSTGCVFMYNFYRLLQLLYASAIVWVNIEVFGTIISPRPGWNQSKLRRFLWSCGITSAISLIIVIIIVLFTYRLGCWHSSSYAAETSIHLLKNWIPGIMVIVLFILNIVGYVKLRTRGLASFNQFVPDSPVAIRPTEWFICVAAVDIIFLSFEILFVHLSILYMHRIAIHAFVLKIMERLLLLTVGFPIVALSHVRQTIFLFLRRMCGRGDRVPVETQDMNCDAIEDESL